jgi:CDP-glycerol glycerophosphotransferase (TagB/SpsB family)
MLRLIVGPRHRPLPSGWASLTTDIIRPVAGLQPRPDPARARVDDDARPMSALVRIGWERIQLVVELRGSAPAAPRLEHRGDELAEPDEPTAPMPPTWSGATADGHLLRFNVMLGPGQAPLADGTWILCATPGEPLVFDRPDVVEVALAERSFGFRGGRYRVAPMIDRRRGLLCLEVTTVRAWTRSGALRRQWRRLGRATRRPRRRLFDALLAFHRSRATRTGRRVLFTSDSRTALSGNLAVVHDRMVERGLDATHQLDAIFKPSIAARRSWRDRWRLPRLLAQADVILLDDYQPIIYRLPPDPEQRIVQLWHASGAFKTVGYSRIGKPGGPSPFWRRHKNYTHAIVSGQHDVPYYAEAFGLPEDRVIPTGIPRMDRFFDPAHRAASLARAREAFPQIAGRFVILFAPTFRGAGPRSARYDYEQVDWPALHATCLAKDAVVIVKMHPFIREPAPIPDSLRDRLVDATRTTMDVNDLLFAVDLLITDYSSIVFEFSTQLKPMLFFAYDLEEYVASRDFYVPFDEFVPGRIARTFDEVVAAIQRDEYEAEKVPIFRSRHFDHLDGGATDRVIDQLILGQ